MRRLVFSIVAAVALASIPALASAEDPSSAFDAAAAARATYRAELAAASGDWPSATRLMEAAYRADPNIGNEFNLATAYARAGRVELAIPLYEDVARKGQFTMAAPIFDRKDADTGKPRKSFNYSDEALRRIALLTDQPFPARR